MMDKKSKTYKSYNIISIYDVKMSQRLKTVLRHNNIMYISQLSYYSKKDILCFRGITDKTMIELEKIYRKYNISEMQPVFIDELPISEIAKNIMHELGFTLISELDNYDYISLTQKFTKKRRIIYSIIQELNKVGYLLPSENEISIYDVQMPKRLLKILELHHILYLAELSTFSKEEMRTWHNLGDKRMSELEEICEIYNIQLHSVREIEENLSEYKFSFIIDNYIKLYNFNIICIEDFNHITTRDLYYICNNDYLKTMKSYYILKNNGICFQSWDDRYMFEVLTLDRAKLVNSKFRIQTIAQLQCRIEYIDNSVGKIPQSLKTRLKAIIEE